jgi:hypothetical protein
MTRKTANNPINTPISGVVPQPGVTFPYSEFRGFRRVPRFVTNPSVSASLRGCLVIFEVAIKKLINLRALQKDLAVF